MFEHKEKAAGGNQAAVENTQPYNAKEPHKQQTKNPLLFAALEYALCGRAVLPVKLKGKNPLNRNGCNGASKDPAVIENWWRTWPDANIGIATGAKSGFWALDIDGEDGESSLAELESQYGALPPTLEVITGGGGRHLYFSLPENVSIKNRAGTVRQGLDVRSDGGYVVAPPSIHESGKPDTPPARRCHHRGRSQRGCRGSKTACGHLS